MEAFQSKATSKDGTTIPYFVIRTKGAPAHAPCLLYAYGGFEISQTPGYAATIGAGWLERGATYVVANIRGGGEFGPTWSFAASGPSERATPSTRRRIGHAIDAAPYRREPFRRHRRGAVSAVSTQAPGREKREAPRLRRRFSCGSRGLGEDGRRAA